MVIVKRNEYNKIFNKMRISMESRENCIDIYHKNNWDRFTVHWDEANKNDCPSYIEFFFDAKTMVTFFNDFIERQEFDKCLVAAFYTDRYKLKRINDAVCEDVYDELKRLLNSLGLKANTNCALEMSKEELLKWSDRISIGGFCGVSEYVILIPELNYLIFPYHHMNYLIYTNDKRKLLESIYLIKAEEISFE